MGALTMVGCASLNVGSYAAPGLTVSRYHTYNWGSDETFATGDPRLDNNRFFQDRIRTSVDQILRRRGFEKTTVGTPDLVVHYHASMTQQIDVTAVDQKYGYCPDCRPQIVDAGTLTVDLVDPASNRLVWRGWAEENFNGAIDNQSLMEATIDAAIDRLFKRLPANP